MSTDDCPPAGIPRPILTNDTSLSDMLLRLGDDYGAAKVLDVMKWLWPGLFESHGRPDSFPARRTDRQTSQQAAARHATRDVARFRWNSVAGRVLDELVRCSGTALEAARRATGSDSAITAETARKRVSELAQAGYIEDSGRRAQNAGSNDDSVVWHATREGATAAACMVATGWSKP